MTSQGLLERTFFTILVAAHVSGAGTAMVAWVALKLASGWVLFGRENPAVRVLTTQSLIVNLVSLLAATIGGLIARGPLHAGS